MPYTYPPQSYEDATGGLQYAALRSFCWWINGTHPTDANTVPWECIDCFDNVTREQPTDGLLSNLAAGNRWKPGEPAPTALAANAWAVFQAPASDITERFQIMVKGTGGATSVTIEVTIFFLNDFVPDGGGPDSSPTLPTVREATPSAGFGSTSNYTWNLVLDEGTITFLATPSSISTPQWLYVGEVEPANPQSLDPRPFIISDAWSAPSWSTGFNSRYRGISAVTTTVMNVLNETEMGGAMDYAGAEDQDAFTTRPLCSVSFHGNVGGSRYTIGRGRNTGALSKGAGTTDLRIRYTAGFSLSDFRFIHWTLASETDPRCVTLYPPEVVLDDHTLVSELSVPTTLIPDTGADDTPPAVVYVNPSPGTQIRSDTAITINVTDDSLSFSGIQLRVSFPSAQPPHPTETIHSGDRVGSFEPFYQDSTILAIAGGFQFVLTRVNPDQKSSATGWPATPTFTVTPVDSSGNAA